MESHLRILSFIPTPQSKAVKHSKQESLYLYDHTSSALTLFLRAYIRTQTKSPFLQPPILNDTMKSNIALKWNARHTVLPLNHTVFWQTEWELFTSLFKPFAFCFPNNPAIFHGEGGWR